MCNDYRAHLKKPRRKHHYLFEQWALIEGCSAGYRIFFSLILSLVLRTKKSSPYFFEYCGLYYFPFKKQIQKIPGKRFVFAKRYKKAWVDRESFPMNNWEGREEILYPASILWFPDHKSFHMALGSFCLKNRVLSFRTKQKSTYKAQLKRRIPGQGFL